MHLQQPEASCINIDQCCVFLPHATLLVSPFLFTPKVAAREASVRVDHAALDTRAAVLNQKEAQLAIDQASLQEATLGHTAHVAAVDRALDARAAALAQRELVSAGHKAALAAAQQGFQARVEAVAAREQQASAAAAQMTARAAQLEAREQSVQQAAALLQAACQAGEGVSKAQLRMLIAQMQQM